MSFSTALLSLLSMLLPLGVLALAGSLWGAGGGRPWRLGPELAWAALSGVAGLLLCQGLLAGAAQGGDAVVSSDFLQICASLERARTGDMAHWSVQRSVLSAGPAIAFSKSLGLIDGLVASSLLGQGLVFAGLSLWASALGGRLAGGATMLLACAIAPLATLGHMATFYPPMLAAFVWVAAGAAVAWRDPRPASFLLAGLGLGLALAVDARGMIFGLPAGMLTLLALGRAPGAKARLLSVGLLLLCLGGSWALAHGTSRVDSMGLDEHMAYYIQDALRFSGRSPDAALERLILGLNGQKQGFVWGQRGLSSIPLTLGHLVGLQAGSMRAMGGVAPPSADWVGLIGPWLGVGALGAGLSLHALRKSWAWVGLALTAAPFLISLQGSLRLVAHTRYLANGAPVFALLGGLGLAFGSQLLASAGRPGRRLAPKRPLSPGRGKLLSLVLLALLVIGLPPSGLGPQAGWRQPVIVDDEPTSSLLFAASDGVLVDSPGEAGDRTRVCIEGLRADLAAGLPVGSRLLGWTASAQSLGPTLRHWPNP